MLSHGLLQDLWEVAAFNEILSASFTCKKIVYIHIHSYLSPQTQ